MFDPNTTELATQLTEVAARNAASTVASKIAAFRARKHDQEVVNDLIELVNDLVEDKNQLTSIARAFEQELVAQRISEEDITYITTQVIPVVERLAGFAEGGDTDARRAIEAIKSLVSVESLTIMQLVGFNFRRAIGEPLTTLVERLILSRMAVPDQAAEQQSLQLRRDVALFEALRDPEARPWIQGLLGGQGG